MKFYAALISLIAVATTGSLMSMEDNKQCFNVVINQYNYIRAFSKKLGITPPIEGRKVDLSSVIQMSTLGDFIRGQIALRESITKNETIKVPYMSECLDTQKQEYCTVTLTAMITEQVDRHAIFIKIQENVQNTMIRQKERRRLNFLLDTDKKIIAYSQQNMAFAVEPSEFLNKSIIDIIPLGEEAREAINQSFCIATEKDEPYILEEKDFVTKIVPLQYMKDGSNMYFVKIKRRV